MPQLRSRSQPIEFSKFPQQRLDASLAPLHEAPLEPPAILGRAAVRGSVAMILVRLEARVEAHTIEQPRMHLGRIRSALLMGDEKHRCGIFVHFSLGLEFQSDTGASRPRRQAA